VPEGAVLVDAVKTGVEIGAVFSPGAKAMLGLFSAAIGLEAMELEKAILFLCATLNSDEGTPNLAGLSAVSGCPKARGIATKTVAKNRKSLIPFIRILVARN
jgi:hypothetical protein